MQTAMPSERYRTPIAPTTSTQPRRQAMVPRLLLLGTPQFERQPRHRLAGWSYAKLPALLAVLAADGRAPVRREWLAALLWPDRSPASLRRALFDLRRELGEPLLGVPLLLATRQHLQLAPGVATDLDVLEAAWRTSRAAGGDVLDVAQATRAMALWRGDLAADLNLHDADEFEFWLSQARGRWQQRALAVAAALVAHHLASGDAPAATKVARQAVERAPGSETARIDWWRSLVAGNELNVATNDWKAHCELLRRAELVAGPSLQVAAEELGLGASRSGPGAVAAVRAVPSVGVDGLTRALADGLRSGGPYNGAEALLDRAQEWLVERRGTALASPDVVLARLTFTLRLHVAPWLQPMNELTELLEALLVTELPVAERLSMIWPLATYHGWMGRGLRGEVLLRGVGPAISTGQAKPGARVAFELAMGLCHSCATGNPELSLRAARRGLRLAREQRVVGYQAVLRLVEANAALNFGDLAAGERALRRIVQIDEPLRPADLAHYHQITANLRLLQGRPDAALAEAQQGLQLARRLPQPMQVMACQMAEVAARAMLGEGRTVSGDLRHCLTLARRIGADGYLMNLLLLAAVLDARCGDADAAAQVLGEALMHARRCGVRRLRKLPPELLAEALAPGLRERLEPHDRQYAAALGAALPPSGENAQARAQ